MICQLCNRDTSVEGLCNRCHSRLHSWLDDLPEFWRLAHDELLPGRTGSGASSTERTIGLNVNALSFIAGDDILGVLHEWERLIREERQLTKPALLKKLPLADEITTAVVFAQTHLQWSGQQAWIEDFATELAELHHKGMSAAKAFVSHERKIPCPATMPDGEYCGFKLKVNKDDPMDIFSCPKCKSEWTTLRMVAVALSSPGLTEIWLDAEAIGSYLNMSAKNVQQFARRHHIRQRGELYDLKAFLAARHAGLDKL